MSACYLKQIPHQWALCSPLVRNVLWTSNMQVFDDLVAAVVVVTFSSLISNLVPRVSLFCLRQGSWKRETLGTRLLLGDALRDVFESRTATGSDFETKSGFTLRRPQVRDVNTYNSQIIRLNTSQKHLAWLLSSGIIHDRLAAARAA